MAVKNSTILAKSWLEGSTDMQQRIPNPDQTDMATFNAAMFDPMNNDIYNQWSNGLINRIGLTIANSKRFSNPLAVFKRPYMAYGKTVQNIAVEWAKTHSFKDDAEDLLKYERPEFAASYHTINRQDKYKVSITRPEMRQAIAQDGYGLNTLVDMAVSSCTNAEQYDEMRIMQESIGEFDKEHPVFKANISVAGTKQEQARALLEAVKTYVNRFKFPSTLYNVTDYQIPTFANENECVIIVNPDTMAMLDVYAFAELFNVDRAEVRAHVVMLPELPIAGAKAILTTQDVFIAANTEYGMFPFFDPNTLTTHNFLHSQGVYSINPFAPIVAIGEFADYTVPTTTLKVTGVDVSADTTTVEAGGDLQLTVKLQGTVTGDDAIEVKPDAVVWTVKSDTDVLKTKTYVDRYNVLHTSENLTAGSKLTVTGVATYTNPDGTETDFKDSVEITVA